MEKDDIIKFIEKTQNSWKPVCIKVSLFSALVLYLLPYFFPTIKIDPKWIFSSISMGLIATVFILLEIHKTILQKEEPKTYANLKAAEPAILQTITDIAKRKRNDPIVVKVLGNRLSRVSPILSDIFRKSNQGKFGQNKIEITVYHTDPTLISKEYLPSTKDRSRAENKHQSYSANLLSNISWLSQNAEDSKNVSLKFVKYLPIPYFYAYLIDKKFLFWGYFTWDEEANDWIGPSNKCYYIENRKDDPTMFIDWVKNRLKIYDIIFDK